MDRVTCRCGAGLVCSAVARAATHVAVRHTQEPLVRTLSHLLGIIALMADDLAEKGKRIDAAQKALADPIAQPSARVLEAEAALEEDETAETPWAV